MPTERPKMTEAELKAERERNMTSGGVAIVGDDVIYDGEAERLGLPPMRKAPKFVIPEDERDDD